MNGPDFEIKISTAVQLNALRDLERSLEAQIAKARALGKTGTEAYRGLQAELGKVRGQLGGFGLFDKAKAELLGFAESIPGLGAAMRVLNGSLGPVSFALGGIAAAAAGAAASLKEFAGDQEKIAKLDVTLANAGLQSRKFREEIQALGGELQDATAIADDQWYEVFERLIKQGGATEESLRREAESVKNLAGLIGGDLQTAAQLYIRAKNGSTATLSKYGIKLKETSNDQEKFNDLLKQIDARGVGVLEAQSKTLAGQIRAAGLAWDDFKGSVGNLLYQTGVVQWFASASKATANFLNMLTGRPPIEKLQGIENKLDDLGRPLQSAKQGVDDLDDSLGKVDGDGIEKAKKAAELLVEALQKGLDKITELRQAQDELADADLAIKLAQVDADVKSGKMTDMQGMKARQKLRQGAEQEKFERSQGEKSGQINAIDQEIKRRRAQQRSTGSALNEATEKRQVKERMYEERGNLEDNPRNRLFIKGLVDEIERLRQLEQEIQKDLKKQADELDKVIRETNPMRGKLVEQKKQEDQVFQKRAQARTITDQSEIDDATRKQEQDVRDLRKREIDERLKSIEKEKDKLPVDLTGLSQKDAAKITGQRSALYDEKGQLTNERTALDRQDIFEKNLSPEIRDRELRLKQNQVGREQPLDAITLSRQARQGIPATDSTVSGGIVKEIERLEDGLQNGDQGGETQALSEALKRLGDAIFRRDADEGRLVRDLAKQVQQMASQLANSRGGGNG